MYKNEEVFIRRGNRRRRIKIRKNHLLIILVQTADFPRISVIVKYV